MNIFEWVRGDNVLKDLYEMLWFREDKELSLKCCRMILIESFW